MATIDIDAKARARAETRGEFHDFVIRGEHFNVPADVAWAAYEEMSSMPARGQVELLLGDQAGRFFAIKGLTYSQVVTFLQEAGALIAGADSPNPEASSDS
jgi:hypothetical protein